MKTPRKSAKRAAPRKPAHFDAVAAGRITMRLGETAEQIDQAALVQLLDDVAGAVQERDTFEKQNADMLAASKAQLESAKAVLSTVDDPAILETVYAAISATQLCTAHLKPGSSKMQVADARRLVAAATRKSDARVDNGWLRATAISTHYKHNPPTGLTGHEPFEQLLPSPQRMMLDPKLRRELAGAWPNEHRWNPQTRKFDGLSISTFEAARRLLVGEKPRAGSKKPRPPKVEKAED